MNDFLTIGQFGRAFGVRGSIIVRSSIQPITELLVLKPWFVFLEQQLQQLVILQSHCYQQKLVVNLQGYVTRETVALLTNKAILVPPQPLPKALPDEYYWHELIGLQVYNQQRHYLGDISKIIATAANDVLVVQLPELALTQYLIPYISSVIITVDLGARRLIVAWDTAWHN